MFAILGDIAFEITGSPEELIAARRYDYVEHRVIEGRPRLQWIGENLEILRLKLLLHNSLADPALNLALLQAAAASHTAMPLVFGNGDFRGYFVVVEIETLSRQLSGRGDPLAISVRITLRECVPDLDPTAAALSLAAIGISAALAAGTAGGVSALLRFSSGLGLMTPNLQPDDVSPDAIVRSILP